MDMCYRGMGLGWRELRARARERRARMVADAVLYVVNDPWRMVAAGVLVIGLVASLALWTPGCADPATAPEKIEAVESPRIHLVDLPRGMGRPMEVEL